MSEQSVSHKRARWRPGIQLYLVLMNLVLLCLLFPTISIFFFHEITDFRDAQLDRTINNLRQSLEGRGTTLSQSLALSAEQAISGYDFTFLNNLLAQVVDNDPELLYSLVMNTKRLALAHNDLATVSSFLEGDLALQSLALADNYIRSTITQASLETFSFLEGRVSLGGKSYRVLEVVVPIHSGLDLIGVLRCGFSLEGLEAEKRQVRKDWSEKMAEFRVFFITLTGVFFLVGLLVAVYFTRFFAQSTAILSEGVHQIADGDLKHEIPVHKMFCREFGKFAEGFNEMTFQLRSSLNQLDEYSRSLEFKVEARTSELREAQAELLQQAHEAGMAEMAVGVLHNIGNAITPAKVDASLLSRRLRSSAIRTELSGAAEELADGLIAPEQLSPEKKERLIQIIRLLPDSIREEYDQAIGELEKISAKHEHIEGIIGLQMRYARLIGEQEEIDLNLVVEDALRILGESIERRSVELQKNLNPIPLIRIEQAKMIQIVVNLIKNGYQSMDVQGLPERRLVVSTFLEQGPPPQVVLSVKDTGIGFGSEQKDKLFTFGYTTKSAGSGFGLHSCANFMIANNGTLSADSDGQGMGAEFIVKLPIDSYESE